MLLTSSRIIDHFKPELYIIPAYDASVYGIEAVLFYYMPNGNEKSIDFVSRMLAEAEKYLQIKKEGLACVLVIRRFHSYLFGRYFKLQTDHKPLLTVFNE